MENKIIINNTHKFQPIKKFNIISTINSILT